MKRSELRALIRECICEAKELNSKREPLGDEEWLTFLKSQWTYKVALNQIKHIKYKKSGKKLVLEDQDGELGNMHVVVTEKNLEYTVFGGMERLTMEAFLKWLIKHGATEAKTTKSAPKVKYKNYSQYD